MFWTAAQGAATLPTAAIGLAAYAAMTESSTSLWEPTPTHFFIGVLFWGSYAPGLPFVFGMI